MSIEEILKKGKKLEGDTKKKNAVDQSSGALQSILSKGKQIEKKEEKPKEDRLLKKAHSEISDFLDVSSANLYSGAGSLTAGLHSGVGGALSLSSKLAGKIGETIYRRAGDVTGLFSDKGEAIWDKVAEDFKKKQFDLAKDITDVTRDQAHFISSKNKDIKDTIIKGNEYAQGRADREQGRDPESFEFKDLATKDFLLYDLYGSIVENAPTMIATYQTGNALGNAQTTSKVANFFSKVVGGGAFGTGINAFRESEGAYDQALNEGVSKEEAIERADRVFKRNATGNSILETAQMALLFAPQIKAVSPLIKGLITSGKLVGAGAVEAVQERSEDSIQEQSINEDFDFRQLLDKLSEKSLSKTDAISFILGVAFQGAGDIAQRLGGDVETSLNAQEDQSTGTTFAEAQEDIQSSEGFDIEKLLKDDPSMSEMIYKDAQNKILTKDFAEGRVSDVAQKLDKHKAGLGDKYKAEIDLENTTYDNIVNKGIEVLNNAEVKVTSPRANQHGMVGNILVEDAFNDFIEQVAERLPDDGQGGTAQERVERGIDTDPDLVQQIGLEVQERARTTSENIREQAEIAQLPSVVEELLAEGKAKNEIILELAEKVGAQQATQIVNQVEQSTTVEDTQAQLQNILDKTPAELQAEDTSLTGVETELREIKERVTDIEERLGRAPARSALKKKLKTELAQAKKDRDSAERRFNQEQEAQATQNRDFIETFVKEKAPDLSATITQEIARRVLSISENPNGRNGFIPLRDITSAQIIRAQANPEAYVGGEDLKRAEQRVKTQKRVVERIEKKQKKGEAKNLDLKANKKELAKREAELESVKKKGKKTQKEQVKEKVKERKSTAKTGTNIDSTKIKNTKKDQEKVETKTAIEGVTPFSEVKDLKKKDLRDRLTLPAYDMTIEDRGGANIQKVGKATPQSSLKLSFAQTRAGEVKGLAKTGVFTDAFILINDKKVTDKLYKIVEKKFASEFSKEEAKDPVEWKKVVPEARSKATIQGYIKGEGIIETVITNGEFQQLVNADKLAFVMKEFPNADLYFTEKGKALVLEEKGKLKALVMPLSKVPKSKFPIEIETAKKKASKTDKKTTEKKEETITLYRGLENNKFDPNYDLTRTDAPYGYSTYTDNPELARQYAGENGFVYSIELPKSKMGEDLFDKDGDRVLFLNNEKKAGLNGISGEEYLVYNHHEDYSSDLVKEYKSNTTSKSNEKIEDVGEKIGGARKDEYAKQAEKYSKKYSDFHLATIKLSESLPPLNYELLKEGGVSEDALGLIAYFRSEIKRRPRRNGSRLRQWVEGVKALRELTNKIIEGGEGRDTAINSIDRNPSIGATIEMYKALDFINDPEVRKYTIFKSKATDGTTLFVPRKNGSSFRFNWGETIEEAIAFVKTQIEQTANKKASKTDQSDFKDNIGVFTQGAKIMTGYKKGSRWVEFEVFEDIKTAREAVKNPEKLEAYIKTLQEIISFDKNTFRKQTNDAPARKYRRGDVSAEEFMNTFGFRGVEFGNWVNQKERQDRLNFAYDSFKDLANVLNVPDISLSLNGELGFAFGSRGRAGAMAHYEPDKVVINLTKKNGSGTIAHEWFHALDNYLARKGGDQKQYLTNNPLRYEGKELGSAFYSFMKTMRGTEVYKRSKLADRTKGRAYFGKTTELGARAFEVYVIEKLKEQGMKNDYLANLTSIDDINAYHKDLYPYAIGEDIPKITEAMDKIFEAIQVDNSPKKAMFSLKKGLNLSKEQSDSYAEILGILMDMQNGNPLIGKTGYENTPNNLMGFSGEGKPNKGFSEEKYSFILPIIVKFPDGDVQKDEIKGLNKYHASERAKRNWSNTNAEIYIDMQTLGERKLAKMWESVKDTFTEEQARILQLDSRFRMKEADKNNKAYQDRIAFLNDLKKRWAIDFDVHFVDTIFAGMGRQENNPIEAWGLYADNSIVITRDALENTDRHEVVHLTIQNADNIEILKKNGITKEALLRAQAEKNGVDYDLLTVSQKTELEEDIARAFETYRKDNIAPEGILKRFFVVLKRLIDSALRMFNVNKSGDVMKDYFDLLDLGQNVNAEVAFLENEGILKSYIKDGALDLRGSDMEVRLDDKPVKVQVTRLKQKENEDARLQKLRALYNRTARIQEELEQNTEHWKKDLDKKVDKKLDITKTIEETPDIVKGGARFTKRTEPKGQFTIRGEEFVNENDLILEEVQQEVHDYLERKAEVKELRKQLRLLRAEIAQARKAKKVNKPLLRDLERKLKAREKYVARKERFIAQGEKRGRAEAKKEINIKLAEQRRRARAIGRIKQIYKRTKQATRTGAYLPIDYQKALTDIFDNYDFTKMTEKTRASLVRTREFFEKEGTDVSKNIAQRLARLEKTAIADLTDKQIADLVGTIEHIYNLGVVKRKLERGRDERQRKALLQKVIKSTNNLDTDQSAIIKGAKKLGLSEERIEQLNEGNIATYEAFRVADMLDGYANYKGENFNQLQRPVAEAVAEANEQSDTLIAQALENIREYGEQFTEEEQARMVYYSALAQGGEAQANALKQKYTEYNFDKPLSEKEAGALEIMRDVFKEVRPEIASTYESINNIPFPDNENYFPFKYDSSLNTFNIDENAFDFSVTKTKNGFTVKRETVVDKVLDKDIFKVFGRSLSEQVYYAKVQPALDTTRSIVNSREYQKASGVLANKFWANFISDVAKRGSSGGVLDALRSNISIAVLGYKLSTIVIQPLAIFDAMSTLKNEFGYKKAISVLPKIIQMTVSKSARDTALSDSLALRERKGGQVEVGEIEALTEGNLSDKRYKRWFSVYKQNAFKAMQFTDSVTASAVFEEFYQAYLEQGMSPEDASDRADAMMKLTQASSNVADRPHIMNTSIGRFLLTFQTFVLNAFNNVRYDLIKSNVQNKGALKGTFYAISAIQFVILGRVLEQMLRDQLFQLIYGGEPDDEDFLKKVWGAFISNVPFINNFFDWDGNVSRTGLRNPVVETVIKAGTSVQNFTKGKGDVDEFIKLNTSVFSLFGVAGTSQVNQLIRSQFNPLRDKIGINDFKTNADRTVENLESFIQTGEKPTKSKVSEIAESIYGENYKEGTVKYKFNKDKEVIKNLAIRQKFGFDDPLVNGIIDAKNNNEKKSMFIDYILSEGSEVARDKSGEMRKPEVLLGQKNSLLSSELYKQFNSLAGASESDLKRINKIIEEESDKKRNEMIDGDKSFALKLYKSYGVISKELYNTIK